MFGLHLRLLGGVALEWMMSLIGTRDGGRRMGVARVTPQSLVAQKVVGRRDYSPYRL